MSSFELYITEKPAAVKAFAQHFDAKPHNGYYIAPGVALVTAFGHLVKLAFPEGYNEAYKEWKAEDLPFLPSPMKLEVMPEKHKQFNLIKNLLSQATTVYNACDADREGDLIFHYIITLAGYKGEYRRILPSDLTKRAIAKIITKSTPARHAVVKSAFTRSVADWKVGINATRAISIASGKVISIGRVVTPTFSLICKRYLDNKNFVPTPFYPIKIQMIKDNQSFFATIKEPPLYKNLAQDIVNLIADESSCTQSVRKQVSENNPLPYFLSSLQIDANKKFSFSSQKTLDLTQSLYEKHKIVTYPRSDSGYLTEELFKEVPERLRLLLGTSLFQNKDTLFDFNNLPKQCINDKKAPNHHGIIPTHDLSALNRLSADESKIFELIASRFLAAFALPWIKDQTIYAFDNNQLAYTASGSVTLQLGWRTFISSNSEADDKKNDDQNQKSLPNIEEGELVKVTEAEFKESFTKAPPLYTDASLLVAMQTCGKKMEDQQLRKAMEDSALRTGGLGTEATRSGVIERIKKLQLVEVQKKKFLPTPMGLSLYEQIKDLEVAKPELTAKWETQLDQIAEDSVSDKILMDQVDDYTKQIVSELLNIGKHIQQPTTGIQCPKCNQGELIKGKKGFGCNRFKDGCDMVFWFNTKGASITETVVQQLIEHKTTPKPLTVKGKYGSYKAFVVLKDDWSIDLEKEQPKKVDAQDLCCPKCKGQLQYFSKGISCVDRDNCGFVVWNTVSGKKVAEKDLHKLIREGKTGLIKGFKSNKLNTLKFDAFLVLNDDYKTNFEFPDK